MRLIDLPITLREAAVKNQIAQGNERDVYIHLNEGKKSGNFDWQTTPQPRMFWYEANEGWFSETILYENIPL